MLNTWTHAIRLHFSVEKKKMISFLVSPNTFSRFDFAPLRSKAIRTLDGEDYPTPLHSVFCLHSGSSYPLLPNYPKSSWLKTTNIVSQFLREPHGWWLWFGVSNEDIGFPLGLLLSLHMGHLLKSSQLASEQLIPDSGKVYPR